jgi:DNA mismatch repair protein MLH1
LADIQTSHAATTLDNIRTLYGEAVANSLLEVTLENSDLGFSARGYVSQLDYTGDKTLFILFINSKSYMMFLT